MFSPFLQQRGLGLVKRSKRVRASKSGNVNEMNEWIAFPDEK